MNEKQLQYLYANQRFEELEKQLRLHHEKKAVLPDVLHEYALRRMNETTYPRRDNVLIKRPDNMERDLKIALGVRLCRNNSMDWLDAYPEVGEAVGLSGETVKKIWPKYKHIVSHYEKLHGKLLKPGDITDERITLLAENYNRNYINHLE